MQYGMNFQLQGTHGAVELSNSAGGGAGSWGQGRIALQKESEATESTEGAGEHAEMVWEDFAQWMATDDAQAALPPDYRTDTEAYRRATETGHNGSDYYVTASFIAACTGHAGEATAGGYAPLGIHEAMDMTLPGLLSQRSAAEGGAWVAVPDSRDWAAAAAKTAMEKSRL